MNIFGYGGRPQGKWDNPSSNMWQVGGQTLDEYIESNKGLGTRQELTTRYWQERDVAIEAARQELEAMRASSSVDLQFTNTITQDAAAVAQVQGAAAQWAKLDRITSGNVIGKTGVVGGTVLGYDLETFGDTLYGKRGEFGITEFGIGTTTFKEGGLFTQKGHSLAIGLSDDQAKYVTDILDKYKAKGWSTLNNAEQVTMQRMSMYAGTNTNFRSVFSQITEEGDFKGMWEVKSDGLIAADMSVERIQRGIDNLQAVYRAGATSDAVLPKAMDYLRTMYGRGTANQGAVLTAANSSYDITTLMRYTDGKYDKFLNVMGNNTVDLIYGVRTAAAARSISVAEYQRIMHGARGGGASVQSLLLSTGLNEVETHMSLSDINQQIQLLAARNFAKGRTLGEDLSSFFKANAAGNTVIVDSKGKEMVKSYDAKNTVFLLNRGWLDKRNGTDFALIDTGDGVAATQNYTVSGEYWELDPTLTGQVDDGYRLSMTSTADGTVISKRFGTKDQAVAFLRENADWFDRGEVINSTGTHRDINVERQIEYKYQDRGRRAFERAIDPASVAVDNDKPANGFAAMEQFLEWQRDYGDKYSVNPEGFRKFVADMRNSDEGFNINLANSMQEFIGAQAKVADEKALLQTIVNKVNAEYGQTTVTNNMQKTIAFRRAYENAIDMMTSKGRIQHSKKHQNLIMNDIFGVDVKMPDGRISRINAHTTSSATKDVSRIFGQMTKEEVVSTVDDLVARRVISKKQGGEFSALLREIGVESGKETASRVAIEKYLNTESTYQLYTDIGYALSKSTNVFRQTSRDTVPKSFAKKRQAKKDVMPEFTLADTESGGSFSARMQEYTHKRYITSSGAKSITEMLTNDTGFANQVTANIQDSIRSIPVVSMSNDAGDSFKQSLLSLTQQLGYGDDIITTVEGPNGQKYSRNLIEEMFFKKGKSYAAAKRPGVHSIIIRPSDNGSAFALFTNNKHYGHLMEELSKVQASDIATYQAITGSSLNQYATIYELPKVNRYTVGEHVSDAIKAVMGKDFAELVTLQQSENAEKFLISRLNVDAYGAGNRVHAYMNNGVYDYLSSWRMRGGLALDKVEAGEFEDATKFLRQQQNEKLNDLSSSASYRGYWETDPLTGARRIVRKPNYTPADYMYASRVRMTDGLHDIFKYGLTDNEGTQRNSLDMLVDAYGEAFGKYRGKRSAKDYRTGIADSTYFKEFFNKNLFLGTIADDAIAGGIREVKDKNVFSLIQDVVNKDTANIFDDSVRQVLKNIAPIVKDGHIYQVLSNTAMEHGDVSLGVATGEYNVNAFLYSTMRPTYSQQNLGRLFDATKEWDEQVFSGDRLRTMAGSPEMTIKEYNGLTLSKFFDGYENQVRHVMTGFKQMGDYDLQLKYAFMSKNAAKVSSKMGVSTATYRKALAYMREDMLSLNEGKWFMDPRMAQQQIVSAADAKKVKLLDIRNADAQRSGEVLQALVNKALHDPTDKNALITANTIVGYTSNGTALFAGNDLYTGLDQANLEDIFDIKVVNEVELVNGVETVVSKTKYSFKNGATGFTRVIPGIPDIRDTKLMFNGSEKATAHAIDVDAFLKYMHGTEIADKDQAMKLLSGMFQQVSDGATLIGNMSLQKHGNITALDSPWRIITSEYVARGQGQSLVNYLNKQVKSGAKAYTGIKEFKFVDGRIISDTSHAANPAAFLMSITNDILNNVNRNSQTNNAIRKIIDYTRANNISYGAIEFMNQNEHVSDGIAMDKRIEQGIRQRAYAMKDGKHWDQQWADELVNFAENYTGRRDKGGSQYGNLHRIFDFANQNVGFNKIQSRNKRMNMEKALHGIVESLVYYEDPNAFDVGSKNILTLDFQKLMGAGIVPQNGVSVNALQSSLFFTDGKPSEALQKLAAEQGIDFGPMHSSYSNSLYIDLGSYAIKSKDGMQDMHGFLIPIQNVITDADETMFQTQQGNTARMLSRVQALIEKPGKRSTSEISAELSKVVREYYRDSMKQLAVADKNSDYYKAIQRHFMPNSGGMLAEQEVAPLVYDEKSNDRLQELLRERQEIESRIANRQYGASPVVEDLSRLDGIYEDIKIINERTAKRIKDGEVLDFTQLKGTSLEGLTKEIVNGETVYGYVAATSRKAFEDQGLNFSQLGMDIITDLETNGKLVPKEFLQTAREHRTKIMQAINEAQIEDLTIEDEATMMKKINEWSKRYGTSDAEFTTKGLNEAIANGGPINRVSQAFEGVAEDYMRQVGVVGELIRYPTFRSQFASRFIMSDHITSNQVVMFNPVASSITNVDFDGDLMYSIFRFNGGSGLLSKNMAQLRRQAYESSISSIPELLAKLVEDGEAYNAPDNVNDAAAQMAALLKKMDRESYEKARTQYMVKHRLGPESMTAAHEFAFHTSQEVRDAFLDLEFNTLFDIRSQKASIAPVLRKENIGYISTTNFNARTMIQHMVTMYEETGNAEAYNQATAILNAVTSPKGAKGGLFDVAEQSGIDTKHVWDAMTTAETARYSTGMQLLFGKYALPRKGVALETQQRVAVEHIVSSLYTNVFKDTNGGKYGSRQQNIKQIVDEIMAHKADWQTFDFGKIDTMPKRGVAALLAMQELDMPNNLANLRKVFASSFNKGYDSGFDESVHAMESVSDLMEMYRELHKVDAEVNPDYYHSQTYFKGLSEFIQKSFSDRSLQVSPNTAFAMTSSLKGWAGGKMLDEDLVFSLREAGYTKNKATATFDVFSVNREKGKLVKVDAAKYADAIPQAVGMKIQNGSVTFSARYNGALNEILLGDKGFLTGMTQISGVAAIRNNTNKAQESFTAISRAKVVQSINDVVINPSGSIASAKTVLNNIQYLKNINPQRQVAFGQSEYDLLSGLFAQPGIDINVVAKRTSELTKTYEYAKSTGQIQTRMSTNELLTSINNDIAAHPERYKAQPNDIFTKTFDKILEQRMVSDQIFASVEQIEDIRQTMMRIGDFDTESYNKILQDLRSSLYDTQKEKEMLANRYKQLFASNPYGQTQVVQDAQATIAETIGKFEADVRALNQTQIDTAQSQIYSLFKSKTQMETFFGWKGNVSLGAQKVGFGMHIGRSFDSLSRIEAFSIIADAQEVLEDNAASREAKFAAETTSVRLGNYVKDVGLPDKGGAIQFKQENSKVLEESLKTVDILQKDATIEVNTVKEAADELLKKSGVADATAGATEGAASKGGRKSLTSHVIGQFKDFAKEKGIIGKHVGIAVAGMAALGVVNNLLHNQKMGSPLSPARKPNGNGSPSIDGYYPDSPEEAHSAPASTGGKTVYQSGGLNFRVSASTARSSNARQQAAQMSSITGGSTNISVQQDTSRVTDNWLSNKFADLV